MRVRCMLSLGLLIGAFPAYAFDCYVTLLKDSCWLPYEINVSLLRADNRKELISVKADKGQSWARVKFNCSPGMNLLYRANYQPVFWESEQGKSYYSKRYWSLPMTVDKDTSAWEIQIFYPRNFSEIPFPPDAIGNCQYNLQAVPAIPKAKALQQK